MEPEKKSNGAFIGVVVIIVILIVGGVYIWQSNQKTKELMQKQAEAVTQADAAALNALELEAESTNSDTGVDANNVD